MFQECIELVYLDLSNFNTSNVSDMSFMFNNCQKLREIKGIKNFNTSNVTIMKAMFQKCYELEYIDLSNFNTDKVTDMSLMFNKCIKLREIKGINNFNTSKVTNMRSIFNFCNLLDFLDLENFNRSGIINDNIEKKRLEKLRKEMEGLIAINFTSINQNVNSPIICNKSDLFRGVEEKLYNEYPRLRNKNIFFMANGNIINRNETLEQNKIEKGNAILIYEEE